MNAKNLPLKFAFLALVIALSISCLFWKGLNFGIDLEGGYSLIFEIRTNAMEQARLENDKKAYEKRLADENDPDKQEQLRQLIRRTDEGIARYASIGKDNEVNLTSRMIATLKERIDPNNMRGIEWRPQGDNRIEVRMPAGRKETRASRDTFRAALEKLDSANLTLSGLRRLVEASDADWPKLVEQLSCNDAEQAGRLETVVRTYQKMRAAQEAHDQAWKAHHDAMKTYDDLLTASTQPAAGAKVRENLAAVELKMNEMKEAFDKASKDLDGYKDPQGQFVAGARELHDLARQDALKRGVVASDELQRRVLSLYVSASEAETAKREGRQGEVERSNATFQEKVNELVAGHPARAKEIQAVVETYKKWSDTRQYLEDPSDLKRLIARVGVLEFRIVPFMPNSGRPEDMCISVAEYNRYKQLFETEGPDEIRKRNEKFIWLPLKRPQEDNEYAALPLLKSDKDDRWYMLVYNQDSYQMLHEAPPMGWMLTDAWPTYENGRPAVSFKFDERGSHLFGHLTEAHKKRDNRPGRPMAILLDDVIYSAPSINDTITSQGIITGRFSTEEVNDLSRTLNAGSLPARLNPNPVSENNFGPAMGEVNLQQGLRAGYWSLIAVGGLMLAYYLLAGAVADVALLLNLLLILGSMSILSAVFTLPGIAGVILTIGMAVDANVLIYERLREEQAKGLTVRMALKSAYERAFSAIFDSNITTLITCLILGWVGSEEVRGFAITLGLGVLFNLLTAVVVTRWVFQFMLDKRIITRPLRQMRLIGVPKINWMSKRYWFWGMSATFMVLGIASLVWQGDKIWGIEFSKGTQKVVKFKADALLKNPGSGKLELLNDGLVQTLFRNAAQSSGTQDASELNATAIVEKRIDPNAVRSFLADNDHNGDGKVEASEFNGNKEFFKLLDSNSDNVLSKKELDDNLPAREYQISTTVTDLAVIQQVIDKAFGVAMETRLACRYSPVAGVQTQTSATTTQPEEADSLRAFASLVGPAGWSEITASTVERADLKYRYEIEDYQGGLLFVYDKVSPAIAEVDLRDRIRDMRDQIDFNDLRFNSAKVIPLTPSPDDPKKFTSFAVLVRSAEGAVVQTSKLAADEGKLIGLAFQRSETGETRSFDAQIAGEMARRAIMAVALGWIAIIIYLWFRFGSMRWGFAAVICLIHDVIIVVGLVAVSGWLHMTVVGRALAISSFKIDLTMIAAILTIIGYSVNDTIVVFDRIRENRGKLSAVSVPVINASINQTLSRTILTSGTTLIVIVVMYIWGGAGIHAFSYALLAGVAFGTYSSIAVASPILLGFKAALVSRMTAEPVEQIQSAGEQSPTEGA